MSKVSITRQFTMPVEDVKSGMQTLSDGLKKDHGMHYEWVSDTQISFKHKAGKGDIHIEGDEVHLNLKLSMLYAAMAPVVRKRVNDWADEYIS